MHDKIPPKHFALKSEPPFGVFCLESMPFNLQFQPPQNRLSVFIIPACCERSPGKGGKRLEGTTHDQPKQVESRGETTTELQLQYVTVYSEEIHQKSTIIRRKSSLKKYRTLYIKSSSLISTPKCFVF